MLVTFDLQAWSKEGEEEGEGFVPVLLNLTGPHIDWLHEWAEHDDDDQSPLPHKRIC